MKRKRQSWATRKLPPLTLAELDRHLDMLAALMAGDRKRAPYYLLHFQRVEAEREKFLATEAAIEAAVARLTRSADRTEARSA